MATSEDKVKQILSDKTRSSAVQDLRKLVIDGEIDVQNLTAKTLYELVTRGVIRVRQAESTESTLPRAVSAEWNNDEEIDFAGSNIEVVDGVPVVYLSKIKKRGLTDEEKKNFESANSKMPKATPASTERKPMTGEVLDDTKRNTGGAAKYTITREPTEPAKEKPAKKTTRKPSKKKTTATPPSVNPHDVTDPAGKESPEAEEEPSIAHSAVELGETPEDELDEVIAQFYDLPKKVKKNQYAFATEDPNVRVPISLAPTHINLKYVQNFDIATLESSYKLFLGENYESSQVKKCIDDLKGACKDSKSLKYNKIKQAPAKFKAAMERLSCLFTYNINLDKINYSALDKWAQNKYKNDPEKYKKFLETIVLLNDPNNKEVNESNQEVIKQAKIDLANYIGEYEADLHKDDLEYQKKLKNFLDITAVTGASIVGGLALRYLMAIPNHLSDPWGLLMLCLSVNGVPVVGIMAGLALASGAVLVIAKIIKASIDSAKQNNKQSRALKQAEKKLKGHKQGLAAIRKKYGRLSPNMSADDVAKLFAEPKNKEEKALAKKAKTIADAEDALQLLEGDSVGKRLSKKKSLVGRSGLEKKIAAQVKDDVIYLLANEQDKIQKTLKEKGIEGLYLARLQVALKQAEAGKFESLRDKKLAKDIAKLRKKNAGKPIVAAEVVAPEGKKITDATKLGVDRKYTEEEYLKLRGGVLKENVSEKTLREMAKKQMQLDEMYVMDALKKSAAQQKKNAARDKKDELKALEKEQRTDSEGKVHSKKEIKKAVKKTKKDFKKAGDKAALDLMKKTAEEKKEKYLADRQEIIDRAKESAEMVSPSLIASELGKKSTERKEIEEKIASDTRKQVFERELSKETIRVIGHKTVSGLKKVGSALGKPFRAMFPPKQAQTGTVLGGSPTSVKASADIAKAKGGIAR